MDPSRCFAVIVHDVTPAFLPELVVIAEALSSRAGDALIGAVVPCWHGQALGDGRGKDDARFARLVESAFGEVLQHGYTHRQDRPGVISLFSGRSNELGGLTRQETRRRLGHGREILWRSLGLAALGFVPPAWQVGHATPAELSRHGFHYLVGFDSIRPADSPSIPLATWSWDWGILGALGLLGECFAAGYSRIRRDALPCVVVHPWDVRRGYLPRILRVVDRLLREGRTPVRFSELIREQVGGAGR